MNYLYVFLPLLVISSCSKKTKDDVIELLDDVVEVVEDVKHDRAGVVNG